MSGAFSTSMTLNPESIHLRLCRQENAPPTEFKREPFFYRNRSSVNYIKQNLPKKFRSNPLNTIRNPITHNITSQFQPNTPFTLSRSNKTDIGLSPFSELQAAHNSCKLSM